MDTITSLQVPVPTPGPALLIDGMILELLPIAAYVCDAAGRIIRYNRRAAELWGRSPPIGDVDSRFCGACRSMWPDGAPVASDQTPVAEVLRTGSPVRARELLLETQSGSRVSVLVNSDPVLSADGAIAGAVTCVQDITERKQAAEREAMQRRRHDQVTAEQKRRFGELLQALPAAIYKTDGAGRITFYNQAAVELWGVRPELGSAQWCGSWRLYWPDGRPMPHDQCPMAVTLKENRSVRGEALAERPDGTCVPFAAYPTPLRDANGLLVGAVNMLVDISDRQKAEQHQRLLINELNHRVKNTLATVQSIAIQSFRGHSDAVGYHNFEGRLLALSKAHDLLTRESWSSVCLRNVVTEAIAHFRSTRYDPFVVHGDRLRVTPKIALSLAMAVQELGTNALKYGALSVPVGRVAISWLVRPDADTERLEFNWVESGGPPCQPPVRAGFGSRLIERGLRQELNANVCLDFAPTGLVCAIHAPLA